MENTVPETKSETHKHEHVSSGSQNINLSRFAASIVDLFLIGLTTRILSAALGAANSDALGLIIGAIYFGYYHSKDGQSLGMKLVGIKVTKEDGSFLDKVNAGLRYIAFVFITALTLGIGALWALFDKKKETLYDKIFHTTYSEVDKSKTTRSKWIVGCACSLGCLTAILIGTVIISVAFFRVASNSPLHKIYDEILGKDIVKISGKNENMPNDKNQNESSEPAYGGGNKIYGMFSLDDATEAEKAGIKACSNEMKKNKSLADYDFTEFCKCAVDKTLNQKVGTVEAAEYCSDYFPEEVKNLTK